jgi:hypothetical protein
MFCKRKIILRAYFLYSDYFVGYMQKNEALISQGC